MREKIVTLVGTEGQLDKPEGKYAVYTIADIVKRLLQTEELNNYGWSIVVAEIDDK